jgi:hypothetical protein
MSYCLIKNFIGRSMCRVQNDAVWQAWEFLQRLPIAFSYSTYNYGTFWNQRMLHSPPLPSDREFSGEKDMLQRLRQKGSRDIASSNH